MKKYNNLVRLLDLDSDFIIDLRYATPDNFTGSIVYDFQECYIDEHTAHQLITAKNLAKLSHEALADVDMKVIEIMQAKK